MVLRLDPRFPLVWRTPSSLQFGVSAPAVVLHDVSGADERMIAALVAGISRPGLAMVAHAAGAGEPDMRRLLDRLGPALQRRVTRPASAVTVVGVGATADRIADALASDGMRVRLVTDAARAAAEPCDFAVAVAHFVLAPELHGLWLRRDIPHLPVVLSDTAVEVGPVIEPGVSPCLYCLQRFRTDEDAAWPALSAQLWGRTSSIETTLIATETAALASRVILTRIRAGRAATVHRSSRLDAASGVVTTREWVRHPECACGELGATPFSATPLSAAVQPESGSPGAAPAETTRPRSTRSRPTTGSASSALA